MMTKRSKVSTRYNKCECYNLRKVIKVLDKLLTHQLLNNAKLEVNKRFRK